MVDDDDDDDDDVDDDGDDDDDDDDDDDVDDDDDGDDDDDDDDDDDFNENDVLPAAVKIHDTQYILADDFYSNILPTFANTTFEVLEQQISTMLQVKTCSLP